MHLWLIVRFIAIHFSVQVQLQKQTKLVAQIKAVQMHRFKTLKEIQEQYWQTYVACMACMRHPVI